MKIPSPEEIGLPESITKWRSGQEEAIAMGMENTKRVTAISMPTGGGKSPLLVALALLSKQPTCIVTESRGLQTQYTDLFGSIGMVDIRGKRNYQCDLKAEYTCEEGHAARCPYKGTVGCPASQAEMRAATSPLVVTNYAKWTSAKKYGQGMQHFKQVIFDEGHSAPEALASAMQVLLNHHEIEKDLGMEFPHNPASLDIANWKPWAALARAQAESEMVQAQARITGVADPKPSWVRHYTHMRNLSRRLATISTCNPREWIVDEIEGGFQFDPIRPGRYAEAALLLRVPKIIIASATLRPKTMFMLGISKDKFEFKEFDSDFDPKRCPIYYVPTMRVDRRNPDLRMLWVKLDQIAARRQDRKGIIHTVSYTRRDDVISSSRFAGNMIINQRGEAPSGIIDEFRAAEPGSILVSPSVGTGYDFPGSQAEWQFICKIPFPDSRSKIVQARQNDDKEYGPYSAMQNLVQMFGRIMRSKNDRGESFIGDAHLSWFLPRFGHLAPKSFHGFYKEVQTVPPPPPTIESGV
jgi:Rad3-related DNA helicase